MIDDATIKRVAVQCEAHWNHPENLMKQPIVDFPENGLMRFARAIEQLARQEQREEDARICETIWGSDGKEFADEIRAAGKES